MPFKKLRYKKRKPRDNRKNRRYAINKMSSKASVVSDRYFTVLHYDEIVTMQAAGLNTFVFNGNSLFDPNQTGVGHQPRGFDQLASLYTRYKVHACNIKVRFINLSTTQNVHVGIVPNISSTLTVTNPLHANEMTYSKYNFISHSTSGNNKATINGTMMTKVIRGEKDLDDDYSALISANPAKKWHWIVYSSEYQLAAAVNIEAVVSLTYKAEFFRRADMAAS